MHPLIVVLISVISSVIVVGRVDAVMYHVNKVSGSNGNSCVQAQSAGTAKQTVNSAVGCMSGGDTVVLHGVCESGTGDYGELLVGQGSLGLTVPSNVEAEQPGTKIVPNGSVSGHTTFIASPGDTPCMKGVQGLEYPGGGGIFTAFTQTQFVKFDGVGFVGLDYQYADTARGVFFGEGNNFVLQNSVVKYGTIKSGHLTSSSIVVKNMEVGPISPWCQWPQTDPETSGQPCPHGLYMCGGSHVIEDNYFHHGGHTCIQTSCEQGGVNNIIIRRNRLEDCRAVGIGLAASSSQVYSNTVQRSGSVGIRAGGSGTFVVNNTIEGIDPDFASSDVWGIQMALSGGGVVKNNIVLNQRSALYYIANQNLSPINTSVVHHNVCDLSSGSNLGCSIVQSNDALIVTNAAGGVLTLVSGSPAIGAGQFQSGVVLDKVGNSFPNPPDIGAYAFVVGGDVVVPTVSVTAPAGASVVSGTAVSVTASASDNVGVVGVQFKIDSVNLGAEDTAAPYSVVWNTTLYIDGGHVVTAVARDAAGNSATSSGVNVTVDNAVEVEQGVQTTAKKRGLFLVR